MIFLAAAEGGGGFNPLAFDPAAMILAWITFLVALAVLTKVCWRPLLAAVRDREERIARNIEAAETARKEAEGLLEQYRSQMAEARQEVNRLLDEGRASAEKMKKEIVEEARKEAETARERAQREIELARDRALEQLRTEAVDLSIAVSSRILERSLDDQDHRKLAQDILNEI